MSRSILHAAAAAFAAITLGACSPEAFVMNVEMRQPSSSGLDISGKSVSIVYLEEGQPYDSAFTYHFADGFAKKLEEDYFDGSLGVNVFTLAKAQGKYNSRDTLVSLVMDTGDDVVFVVDAPKFLNNTKDSKTGVWKVPYNISVYAYDSMNRRDSVFTFSGRSSFDAGNEASESSIWKHSSTAAYNAGYSSGEPFSPNWKEEQVSVIYYPGTSDWEDALELAYDFKWSEAIDKWMVLAESKQPLKRACAAYNVALGCYFLQEYDLALEWLAQSDFDGPVSPAKNLRSKINTAKARR